METQTSTTPRLPDNTGFDELLSRIQVRFDELAKLYPLFTTNAKDLFKKYVTAFPTHEDSQYHNCNACKDFIRVYGGLVFINEDGELIPAFFNPFETPSVHYGKALQMMKEEILDSTVNGVFYSSELEWGKAITGEWTHFAVRPNNVYKSTDGCTASQAMAEKKEDFKNVHTAILQFKLESIREVVHVLQSETLYRSEKLIGAAEWLLKVATLKRTMKSGRAFRHRLWLEVAKAPAGFCHPKSSMFGTFLEDLEAGHSYQIVKSRFDAKMKPDVYQRPQAAPAAQTISKAEKLVADMGIESAFKRRFATVEDLQLIWEPMPAAINKKMGGGLFSHLKSKEDAEKIDVTKLDIPSVVMTWVRFRDTVLPKAREITVNLPGVGNFGAFVTAADPTAPLIFQWDNPVSWYVYMNGSSPKHWNLPGRTARVTGLTYQPSMWGEKPLTHHGESVFFLLEGAKDNRAKGLALFPEILKSKLHGVRSVVEAFSKAGTIEEVEKPACGLRFDRNGVRTIVTVESEMGLNTYTLDRWE